MLTSLQNSKVKYLVKLREKRKLRISDSCFLVEGFREIDRAVSSGFKIKELYFCKAVMNSEAEKILAQHKTDAIEVSEDVFKKTAIRDGSDGLLAVFQMPNNRLESIQLSNKSIIVALDGVEKPGNLGAILRSCDAVGVSAIVLLNSKVDAYNPNVVRTSLGALFSVPVIECANEEFLNYCNKHKVRTVAASPFASDYHFNADLRGPICCVLGSEAFGLSEFWESNSHSLVKIPMNGVCDSLNVSVAAAVIIYESLRQQSS